MSAGSLFGQAVDPAHVKVNGRIGLNSSYAQVVKLLGKPSKETKPQKEECVGGHEKTVEYPGLTFLFMDGPSRAKKTYLVMSFDVTSPKYTVSSVKIGDGEALVKQKLGRNFTIDTDRDNGNTVWTYEIGERAGGPGWTSITFKKGKVVSIGSSFTVC
jgi:hypothetical protein